MANDTEYGLQAYVFSENTERALQLASRLEVGMVMINGIRFDPLVPFGGVKQSGLGREYGVYGLRQFLEAKSILMA